MAFQAQISGKNKSNRVSSHKLLNSKVSCVRVRHFKYVHINHFNTISASTHT